jgi:hypothetical protein
MKIRDIKDTQHLYKGFVIKGTYYISEGMQVLGGRHWTNGGMKREYKIIMDDGFVYMDKYLIEKLKDAKEYVDEFIKIRTSNLERLKYYKSINRTKQSLIDAKTFPSHFIEKYYDKL